MGMEMQNASLTGSVKLLLTKTVDEAMRQCPIVYGDKNQTSIQCSSTASTVSHERKPGGSNTSSNYGYSSARYHLESEQLTSAGAEAFDPRLTSGCTLSLQQAGDFFRHWYNYEFDLVYIEIDTPASIARDINPSGSAKSPLPHLLLRQIANNTNVEY
jgi:hypothetical protein